MSIFSSHKEFYNQPIKLSEDQKKNPAEVLENFFGDYSLCDCREQLTEWLDCALTTNNPQFSEATERNTISTFAEKLERLIEAAYILAAKKK
jgi:hypothetical protein